MSTDSSTSYTTPLISLTLAQVSQVRILDPQPTFQSVPSTQKNPGSVWTTTGAKKRTRMRHILRKLDRVAGSERTAALTVATNIVLLRAGITIVMAERYPGLFAWVVQHPMGAMFLNPLFQGALLVGTGAMVYDWFYRKMRRTGV